MICIIRTFRKKHRRTKQGAEKKIGKRCKFGQMLGKIEKIRADLSENMLNSGYFITIPHKNFGKLSTLLGGGGGKKHHPHTPMEINVLSLNYLDAGLLV